MRCDVKCYERFHLTLLDINWFLDKIVDVQSNSYIMGIKGKCIGYKFIMKNTNLCMTSVTQSFFFVFDRRLVLIMFA